MINGNQTWQNALLQGTKQPLWVFEITDFAVMIGSFPLSALTAPVGGYGIGLYGVGGYGT